MLASRVTAVIFIVRSRFLSYELFFLYGSDSQKIYKQIVYINNPRRNYEDSVAVSVI